MGEATPDPSPLLRGAALLDLTGRASLFLEGADAAPFLHGLVTNDVKRLRPSQGCAALFLTPKGKLRGEATVLALDGRLLLDAPPLLHSRLLEILGTYLPFHPTVTLLDVTEETAVLHVEGPEAEAVLLRAGAAPPPSEPHAHAALELAGVPLLAVAESRGGAPGWDLRLAASAAPAVAAALAAAGATPSSLEALDAARIEAGVPWWGRELDESVLPDEAGLAASAVSYTKGCYVGQETVARIKTYGHVNRHLVGLLGPAGATLSAGGELRTGDDKVGAVTSAALSARLGRAVGLGFVRREHAAEGTALTALTAAGPVPVTVARFPLGA